MSKVLVFCIDALCASDVARMRRMPHFAQILERGALVEKIEPVLPALTYTCHTSILTGTYAGRHGIVHNEKMTRGGHLDAPWYCMKSDVRGKTLLAPTLGLTMIVNVISASKVFSELFPLFNGNPGSAYSLYTVVYYLFDMFYKQWQLGPAAASAVVLFVIVLIFTMLQLFIQRKWKNY